MKINQNVKFWTSYNTKLFKISLGFSSKLDHYNSINLALCQACLYEHFALFNCTLKSPAWIKLLIFLTTSTKPFCAIRIMFSLLWRAAFRCPISQPAGQPTSLPASQPASHPYMQPPNLQLEKIQHICVTLFELQISSQCNALSQTLKTCSQTASNLFMTWRSDS